jgi:hypothetical protein
LNSGTISGGEAGVLVQGADLDLVNTGTIEGGLLGIFQSGTGGLTLANAGLIAGSSQALFLDDSGNSITLLAGSVLEGGIYFSSADNNLAFGKGLNAHLKFDDTSAMPANVDGNGMPYVVDSANHQIAVVDASGFTLADDMLDDLASAVLDTVAVHAVAGDGEEALAAALPTGETILAASHRLNHGSALWTDAFGIWRDQEEGQHSWSAEHRLRGVVAGIGGAVSEQVDAGVFLGTADGALSVDDAAQDIDTKNVYGGLYVNRDRAAGFARLALLTGWQRADSSRRIANNAIAGGLEWAKARYDALFVVPEVTFGQEAGALLAQLSARYAGLFTEAYEEEGSSADLTVAARDLHGFSTELQLSLPQRLSLPTGGSLLVEPRLGLEGRIGFGEGVDAEVLGIGIPAFDPDNDPVLSFTSGTSAFLQSASGRLSLKLSADAALATDGSLTFAAVLGGAIGF